MLSLNELCPGENPLQAEGKENIQKGVSALQRRGQGCGEGAGQQSKELPPGKEHVLEAASFPEAALGDHNRHGSPHQLH